MRIWDSRWAFSPATPGLLVDGLELAHSDYGFWKPYFSRHAYRGVSYYQCSKLYSTIVGQLPDPSVFPKPLEPLDDRPPVSVITDIEPLGQDQIRVVGCSSDDGQIRAVVVNGREARPLVPDFSRWEVTLTQDHSRPVNLTATAEDKAGNEERAPHILTIASPTGDATRRHRSPGSSASLTTECNGSFHEGGSDEAVDEAGSMTIDLRGYVGAIVVATSLLASSGEAQAQGWPSYAHDPQHTCLAVAGSLLPQKIRWSATVDLSINSNSGTIYIHYGTPVITRMNTVLVPVKTTSGGNYQVQAIPGATGKPIWTASSDYALPTHDWVPIFGITLTLKDHYVVYPGAGGTIYARTFPDSTAGTTSRFAFYGLANYQANPAAFAAAIQICTPISSDALGNLYFGYLSSGVALPGYPNGIPSGLAKVSNTGVGSFIAASRHFDPEGRVQLCSPAFSLPMGPPHVAVNNGSTGHGYLCALSTSTTLQPRSRMPPSSTTHAATAPLHVDDDGSATPTVGPDGDVYYGVLANGISGNHYRGYLLHFDKTLQQSKLPSAFGWDDTASIVPASLVPSYTGSSSYLLLTKYNNYADGGGDGHNRVAVVDPTFDPNNPYVDPVSGITAMRPVISVLGVTPDPSFPNTPGAVREWCINSAAIDTVNKCAVVNSEDGHVYRWSFVTNTLSPGLYLAPSTSEAYTPTVIGPDGAVYAINDAVLYSCVSN